MPTFDRKTEGAAEATVVQFDEAVLEACGPELKAELMTEAAMLAEAFAPEGRAAELRSMAEVLVRGARDAEMDRERARRLACALRVLAHEAET